MGIIKGVLLVAFVAWLSFRIIILNRTLRVVGFGIPVFNHAPGPCKVFYVNGSEDIDVLPNGLAIISSGLFYEFGNFDPALLDREGRLYAFDLNTPEQGLRELQLQDFDNSILVPHGIDLYTDPSTQEIYLFVVNHAKNRESVEIFKFDQDKFALKHWKTVVDENIYSPNDVVAVGPDSFYFTNDHYFANILLRYLEAFYPMKMANVGFYNGTQARIVASQLHFANGINIDRTGQYIFVVNLMVGEIIVYKHTEDNSLQQVQVISVGWNMDNVYVDENNNLWTGSSGISIIEHSKNLSCPCPAKALQVKLNEKNDTDVPFQVENIVEVYSSNGQGDIKAASSAVFYRGKLLVGTIYSNLLYCEVVAS